MLGEEMLLGERLGREAFWLRFALAGASVSALLLVSSTLWAQDGQTRYGLGLEIGSERAGGLPAQLRGQSEPGYVGLNVPLWTGRTRWEAHLGGVQLESETGGTKQTTTRYAVGLSLHRAFRSTDNLDILFGGRVAYGRQSREWDNESAPYEETQDILSLGPSLSMEFRLSEDFSLGATVGLQYAAEVSKTTTDQFSSTQGVVAGRDLNWLTTEGSFQVRWYY